MEVIRHQYKTMNQQVVFFRCPSEFLAENLPHAVHR